MSLPIIIRSPILAMSSIEEDSSQEIVTIFHAYLLENNIRSSEELLFRLQRSVEMKIPFLSTMNPSILPRMYIENQSLKYIGRESLNEVYQKVKDCTGSLNILGSSGGGKSHLLAALACLCLSEQVLSASSERRRVVIYSELPSSI